MSTLEERKVELEDKLYELSLTLQESNTKVLAVQKEYDEVISERNHIAREKDAVEEELQFIVDFENYYENLNPTEVDDDLEEPVDPVEE